MKQLGLLFLCLFILGAGIRAIKIERPVDTPSWREADLSSIARNYSREGMNLFAPCIDWRGSGPGYTEIEFPLYPWAIAVLHKIFGYDEIFGRYLAYIFSLIGLAIFIQLARYLLPPAGAVAASLFYVLSPLAIFISTAIHAEGLMFLCYLTAAYFFIRWIDSRSNKHYVIALLATALTILTKATAAHIGIFFALLVLSQIGWSALRQAKVWIFAIASLLPAAAWYYYAHQLWLNYGNSMGLSNENHWVGADFFSQPEFITGIVRLDVINVWMPAGVVIAALGLLFRWKDRAVRYALFWAISVGIFYVVAARTTSDSWAYYYHIFAVPAAAVLVGAGAEVIRQIRTSEKLVRSFFAYAITSAAALVIATFIPFIVAALGGYARWLPKLSVLLIGVAITTAVLFLLRSEDEDKAAPGAATGKSRVLMQTLIGFAAAACLCLTFFFQLNEIQRDLNRHDRRLFACADSFSSYIPDKTLILASGGECKDPTGQPVAYNSSYMFYWLDRKGWNVCEEEQSLESVKSFIAQGAGYFVAEKTALQKKPGFETALRASYQVVRECDAAILFGLLATTSEQSGKSTTARNGFSMLGEFRR